MPGDVKREAADEPIATLGDRALPTLADALDRATMTLGLEHAWRREEGVNVSVTVGERTDTVYTPGSRCVATYAVGISAAGAEPRPSFGVVEIDPRGTGFRRFIDDSAMPGLLIAADADAMRDRLSAAASPARWEPTPVRYKPGRGCVIRYTAGPGEMLYGKLFAKDAERHAAVLAGLHAASAAGRQVPRVVAPIAVWPQLGMILQRAVRGTALTAAAFDRSATAAARAARMRAAGAALAAIHTGVTISGATVRWDDDIAELSTYTELFVRLAPEIAGGYRAVLRNLRSAADSMSMTASVPSHGACRTDQFLVDGEGAVVVLDLDGFCWADPARDLANILGYLEWRSIRRPADVVMVDAARQSLLEGYDAVARMPSDRRLESYRAVTLLRIAGRRLRRLAMDEWPHLPALVARAGAALAG